MQIESLDAVIFTLQFIIPGYLIETIVSSIIPRRKLQESELVVHSLAYSVYNTVIWYWAFQLIRNHLVGVAFWFVDALLILSTACVTGFAIGLTREFGVIRKVFQRFGINITHPIPTGWDYKFSDGKEYWVEVTVSSGKVIRGSYSTKSLASSEMECRDIFIEEQYVKPDKEWKKVERTAGVWINPDEIRYIKFYEKEIVENVQSENQ